MSVTSFIHGDDGTAYNAHMISAVGINKVREAGYATLQIRLVDGEKFVLCKETFPCHCKPNDGEYTRALRILKMTQGEVLREMRIGVDYDTCRRADKYEQLMRDREKLLPPPPSPLPNEHKE